MAFASIHVPNFSIQAVLRANSGCYRNAIALVDGTAPVETVVAANEAALRVGTELGMTKSQAEDFGIEIRRRSPAQETTAHATLLDLGWSFSPRVEDTAPNTIVVDLAGLNGLFGSDESIANQLVERASSLGLIVNVAVASCIPAAIHASRGFPGITAIPPGEEPEILGRLPVHALSSSEEILETLGRWGIRTCKELAALPLLELSERLGQEGVRLHEAARGTGVRSLVLAQPGMRFEEEMELECSVEELEPLAFILGRLLDQLCARLAARSLAAGSIHSRFKLERSFEEELLFDERAGRWNGNRQKAAPQIYEKALRLPVPMRDSKLLLNLLRLQLQSDPPPAPILEITLSADPARPRVAQAGLFLPAGPDPEKLELTLARLANVVGHANVGAAELMDTHRPLGFRMTPFVTVREETTRRRNKRQKNSATSEAENNNKQRGILRADEADPQNDTAHTHLAESSPLQPLPTVTDTHCAQRVTKFPFEAVSECMAFRVFRPGLPARVEMKDGYPVRITFGGLRGDVVAASGPWRSSGDWWRQDAWREDEWDLEIHFRTANRRRNDTRILKPDNKNGVAGNRGVYRIFFDAMRGAWFVRGMYD